MIIMRLFLIILVLISGLRAEANPEHPKREMLKIIFNKLMDGERIQQAQEMEARLIKLEAPPISASMASIKLSNELKEDFLSKYAMLIGLAVALSLLTIGFFFYSRRSKG